MYNNLTLILKQASCYSLYTSSKTYLTAICCVYNSFIILKLQLAESIL